MHTSVGECHREEAGDLHWPQFISCAMVSVCVCFFLTHREVSVEARKAKQAVSSDDFGKRRNNDSSVQSARERYLARK